MPIDKVMSSVDEAIADVRNGNVLLIGGWGGIGVPRHLLAGIVRRGVHNLMVVTNNCGMGIEGDIGVLFRHGLVRRVHATFPARPNARDFMDAYERGEVELELVPQGTLAERLRAAGAGLGGFFTPTGVGTMVAEGKEMRVLGGRPYVFEEPLRGDVAIIRAQQGDRYGNLRFTGAARNFNPVMAMAADLTIAEIEELVPAGGLDPDDVHTPGIFVDRVVVVGRGV